MKLNLSRRKMRRRQVRTVEHAERTVQLLKDLPLRHGEPCCIAGQDWNPDGLCAWHRLHWHCDSCDGWFGVPHEPGYCHSMQALLFLRGKRPAGNYTRPEPGVCCCTYCRIAKAEGLPAADDYFRKLVTR